jgi:hypothetical protein
MPPVSGDARLVLHQDEPLAATELRTARQVRTDSSSLKIAMQPISIGMLHKIGSALLKYPRNYIWSDV